MQESLLSVAKDVRTQLDAFVALQAAITPQPGFFNKFKRVFLPVDFNKVIHTARKIEKDLGDCLRSLNSCSVNSQKEQEFQQILAQYTAALADATSKMIVTVESLWMKKQDRSAWESNAKLMQEYQLAEQKYLDLGKKLNTSYRKLVESNPVT